MLTAWIIWSIGFFMGAVSGAIVTYRAINNSNDSNNDGNGLSAIKKLQQELRNSRERANND